MRHLSRAVVFATSIAGLVVFGMPASAQQDSLSQQFNDIRTAVGLGKTLPPLDFAERPPLVVPPTYALPAPGAEGSNRLGVNDPDVGNRLKALSDPRRPVPADDPGRSAAGRSARAYLVDPPSGLRDPDSVAADITHDGGSSAAAPTPRRAHRKKKTSANPPE